MLNSFWILFFVSDSVRRISTFCGFSESADTSSSVSSDACVRTPLPTLIERLAAAPPFYNRFFCIALSSYPAMTLSSVPCINCRIVQISPLVLMRMQYIDLRSFSIFEISNIFCNVCFLLLSLLK